MTERELLIKKLTQTRNYYTHGDSKDKYPRIDNRYQ
ncbi:MAG: HEPN domain-containing protein [Streptococcus salivarius]